VPSSFADPTAIVYIVESYAQNAEIATCVSSAHKREVMVHNKLTYELMIE